jgi:predicted metal-dependent phosphoesterase TrpH
MTVKSIISYCNRNSIDVLVITDHNAIQMSKKLKYLVDKSSIRLIPAIEYSTDAGDIIGLFVEKTFESTRCENILHLIRKEGGITVLPHPMKGHDLSKIPMDMIDIIEIKNSRCSSEQNRAASKLSSFYNKAQLVGSDAHFPWELGLALNYLAINREQTEHGLQDSVLKNAFLNAPRRFSFESSNNLNIFLSQVIKGIKSKDFSLLYNNFKNIVLEIIHRDCLKQR